LAPHPVAQCHHQRPEQPPVRHRYRLPLPVATR
jgi:hypothetical protein